MTRMMLPAMLYSLREIESEAKDLEASKGQVDAIESKVDAVEGKVDAFESKVDAIEGMLSTLMDCLPKSRVGLGQVDCITEGRIVRFTCKYNTICYWELNNIRKRRKFNKCTFDITCKCVIQPV